MKYSKAFALLKGIRDKEVKLLQNSIKRHKRETLQKLFKVLSGALDFDEPDTAEVYKKVFAQKYQKEKDYLLRNEYRLLYEWLLKETVGNGISEPGPAQVLQFLLDRRLYELFEEEWNAARKRASEKDDLNALLVLTDLNIQYHLNGKAQTQANALALKEFCTQRLYLLQVQFLRDVRKEEIRLRLAERIITAYNADYQKAESLDSLSLVQLQEGDLYAQYLSLRASINSANGPNKISLLNQILSNTQIIEKYESNPEEALSRFMVNLAQEYYLQGNYEKAVYHFNELYRYFDQLPLPLQESYLLNYLLSLIRNKEYLKALRLAKAHEQTILSSKVLSGRGPFLMAVLALFNRDADAAEEYVDLETKRDGSEFYFFMRLILSGVYYLRGQYDMALREAINIEQAVNYELKREQNQQTKISKPIVTEFRNFYTYIAGKSGAALKEYLKGASLKTTGLDQSPNSVLTQWIVEEIDILSTKKARP